MALGQTVVIDNKPGAGGSLGAAEVAKAEPDGNTLLMGHIGTLAVNPSMYPKLPLRPVEELRAGGLGGARAQRAGGQRGLADPHAARIWSRRHGRSRAG